MTGKEFVSGEDVLSWTSWYNWPGRRRPRPEFVEAAIADAEARGPHMEGVGSPLHSPEGKAGGWGPWPLVSFCLVKRLEGGFIREGVTLTWVVEHVSVWRADRTPVEQRVKALCSIESIDPSIDVCSFCGEDYGSRRTPGGYGILRKDFNCSRCGNG